MSELKQIVELWRTAKARGEEVCLATIVHVEWVVLSEARRAHVAYPEWAACWDDQRRLP